MKVIFLDFDGVIVTNRSANAFTSDPACIQELQRIIDTTQAGIVVSSTWRLNDSENMSKQIAEFGLTNFRFLGNTPHLWQPNGSLVRGHEIQAWLDQNKTAVDRFAIIDDDADMVHLMPFLFKTNFVNGLSATIADRVITHLLGEEARNSNFVAKG